MKSQAARRATMALAAVAPHGDHLADWLVGEAEQTPAPDGAWINEVLKETIADQRPDISMLWLDQRLPTRSPE